jgi:hypothetical protein
LQVTARFSGCFACVCGGINVFPVKSDRQLVFERTLPLHAAAAEVILPAVPRFRNPLMASFVRALPSGLFGSKRCLHMLLTSTGTVFPLAVRYLRRYAPLVVLLMFTWPSQQSDS